MKSSWSHQGDFFIQTRQEVINMDKNHFANNQTRSTDGNQEAENCFQHKTFEDLLSQTESLKTNFKCFGRFPRMKPSGSKKIS